jgi:NAD(P)-dependent dehydrogenase (short-subunit alcohol dehydrogenase family)
MKLEGRVALITGGGSGIGAATARRFVQEGARVALLGREKDDLDEVADDIRSAGGEALVLSVDMTDVEALKRGYEEITERWGRLDIVFANAGINGVWAPIDALEPDDWRMTVDVNLNGTFYTLKYAVPHLRERGGSIIITSSVNGTRMFSNTGATAYACTKAAQVAMAKMLALELARDRIRVNVICPGSVESDIEESTEERELEEAQYPEAVPEGTIPLTDDRPASGEQVAELVLFLASDRASHITGTEVWIDGGQSLLKG